MRFQPHLAEGFKDRDAMRAAAIDMRRAGHSWSQIAKALGFKTGGKTLTEWLRGIPRPEWTRRPRAKDHLRDAALSLRVEGRSYREIQEVLGVSKSSLSEWLRDVPITEEQREALYFRKVQGAERRATAIKAQHAAVRLRTVSEARGQIRSLPERELFVAGVVAYWAEGAKDKPWRNSQQVRFFNSDPRLILLFLKWLDLVEIPKDRLLFRLSIHEHANLAAALRFWSDLVGIPADGIQKSLKRHNRKPGRKNTGKSYHGCLTVQVRQSSELYRRIEGWFEGIVASLEKLPAQPTIFWEG